MYNKNYYKQKVTLKARFVIPIWFTLFVCFTSYGQQVLTKINGGASWQALSAGTDDQNITGCGLSGTNLTIGIENGSSQTVNLASLRDGTGTDNQNVTGCALSGTNLTIGIQRGASQTINLASLRDGTGTDNQNIAGCALNGTNLTIGIQRGSNQTVNLASLVSSTDDQNIMGCALNGKNLTIGIENGSSQTVSLASLSGNGIYSGSATMTGTGTRIMELNGSVLDFSLGSGKFIVGSNTFVATWSDIGIAIANPSFRLHVGVNSAAKPSSSTWTITSDARLKDITGSYDKGLQEILQLNPITYHYKDVGDRVFEEEVKETLSIGFTAQEVREVFPECVDEDKCGYLSLNLHAVNVAYTKAIQELHSMIEALDDEKYQLKTHIEEAKHLVRELNIGYQE